MKFFLLFIALVFTQPSYGQVFAITNEKNNIFYVGLSNPIEVVVNGSSCKTYTVTTDNGNISQSDEDPCHYMVEPKKAGETNITIVSKSADHKILGSQRFRAKNIPDPIPEVAGENGGEISGPVFRAQLGIVADIKGFDIEARFIVEGFTIIILRNESTLFMKNVIGARFTDEVKNALNVTAAGDKIILISILAKGFDGKVRKLQPLEFTLI